MTIKYTTDEFSLGDDGTLDTIIHFRGQDFRFSDTQDFRDNDGYFNMPQFLEVFADEIVECYQDRLFMVNYS
jgi:hypothetical protein